MVHRRKRKAAQSSKKNTQKTRRIDGLGGSSECEDLFSRMPDDCTLEVFNHLDLKSLQIMTTISKRMCELSQYHLALSKNSREGELRIVAWAFGHAFHLSHGKDDPKYMYVIGQPKKTGARNISRIEYSGAFNEMKYRHLVLFKERKTIAICWADNYTPVPAQLTTNLNILLERQSFSNLHLKYIRVDSSLLNYMESVCDLVTRISINGLKVDKDCLERFTKFVISHKLQHFAMRDCGDLCEGLMNAKFFDKFLENCNTSAQCSLMYDPGTHYEETELCRFYPSREIVDSLVRFQAIEMTSLTLEAAWIPELIGKRLKSRHPGSITISITARPDEWNFEQFPHLSYQQIQKNRRRRFRIFPQDIRWNLVEDAESGMQASFYEYYCPTGNVFAFDAEFSKIEKMEN